MDGSQKQLFHGSVDENGTTQPPDPYSHSNVLDDDIKCSSFNIQYAFPLINGKMSQVFLPEDRPITVAKPPVVQTNRMWEEMIQMNENTWISPNRKGLNGGIVPYVI